MCFAWKLPSTGHIKRSKNLVAKGSVITLADVKGAQLNVSYITLRLLLLLKTKKLVSETHSTIISKPQFVVLIMFLVSFWRTFILLYFVLQFEEIHVLK